MNNYFRAPPIPLSDERPNLIQHGAQGVRHDGTLYSSVADPVPVYQDVEETLDNVYHYARRDSEVRNIIKHIKAERSKQEAVYVGMTPQDNGLEETDSHHELDEECDKGEDSDENDDYVCSLERSTNSKDKSASYITVTS